MLNILDRKKLSYIRIYNINCIYINVHRNCLLLWCLHFYYKVRSNTSVTSLTHHFLLNGNPAFKFPPNKPGAAGSHILYDTVTNNVSNPIMFVIFHDSQAVPEYLVTFKRK